MALLDVENISLDDALKRAETRQGYELDPLHLIAIASYFLKLYLLSGGYVVPRGSYKLNSR